MIRVKADTLRFSLPQHWGEISFDQFIRLSNAPSGATPGFVLSTLTGIDEQAFRDLTAYDLDSVINEQLQFIRTFPDIPAKPNSIVVEGHTIALPADLGAYATLGQMWDVDLVIRSKRSDGEAVSPFTMAETLLCVYLWPLLRDDRYTDRHQAASLWPLLSRLSCLDVLAVSAFFLTSFLNPSPSGKVSIKILSTRSKSWLPNVPRFWRIIKLTFRRRIWPQSFGLN